MDRRPNDTLRWRVMRYLRSFPLSYLLTLVAVAGTTALVYFSQGFLDTSTIALIYLLPVGITTAAFGQGAGILAAITSFLAFNYFFVPPLFTFRVLHLRNLVSLVVFLVVAVVTNQLVGRSRRGLEVATEREHEATRLYELSAALMGLTNLEEIAQVVSRQVMIAFRPEHLETQLRVDPAGRTVRIHLPASVPAPQDRPSLALPVQGTGGLLGEISLWTKRNGLGAPQEKLLFAMATQVALALERTRLGQAENRAKVLEQSDALKSALLSSVSHELRSPLATIKAAASSLHTEAVDWDSAARKELLAAIEEEADQLNQLVGNLLDMSRIEAGSVTPQRNWNVLAEIVRSVMVRMRNASSKHTVSLDVSEDLPLVAVDFVMIEQVFANLLSNSIKYSPEGTTIAISAHPRDAEWMMVEVRNQGPPLAPDDLSHVFEPFHRVTAAERVTGTGLGLSICKGLVEAHGGRIWAENVPGGLAFKFTLPLTWGGRGPLTTEEA